MWLCIYNIFQKSSTLLTWHETILFLVPASQGTECASFAATIRFTIYTQTAQWQAPVKT